MLGLASCQQDFDAPVQMNGEVDFQLSVAATELAGTRAGENGAEDGQNAYDSAYGAIDYLQGGNGADDLRVDWAEVDLRYTLEVYDVANDYTNAVPVKDRMVQIVDSYEAVNFDLRLVPNRAYNFVVFADFVPEGASDEANIGVQQNLGLHHVIGNDLRDIKIKDDAINDERTDAYFVSEKITITNSAAQSIVLKRPYGKVRVIATDLADLNLNVNPKAVKVVYTAAHPEAFNAVTGKISAEYSTVEYKYVYGDITKESLANHVYTAGYDNKDPYFVENANGDVRHTHMTLFTDYILAAEQTPYHFTMSVYEDADFQKPIKETVFNTDVPVERNKLTTVIGNVLTTATEINVTIDDNFATPGYNVETVFVSSARELQEALDAFKNGQVIIFEADIKGDVFVHQKQDVNVSIFGDGYKYDGSIKIHNGSNYNNGTLVIKNVNFETATESLNFIMPNEFGVENGVTRRYSNNVTVENCSFTATGAARYTAVGVQAKSCKNVQVLNCTSTNMHSLIQAQSCGDDVVVKNCTVTGKNGVAFKQVQNAVVEHNTIVAEAYGIRFDGNIDNYGITVKDNIVTAAQPFIVRKMTGANNTIALQGENEFVSNDYQIVITNGSDDEDYSVPTGSYSLSGDFNDYFVYPNANQAAIDFRAALADDTQAEITLTEAVKCPSNAFEIYRDVVLNFNNVELNAGSTSSTSTNSLNYALELNGNINVTVNDANFTRAGIVADGGANLVFNSGVINHKPERSSRYIFCAWDGSTITVKDGTFTNDRAKNTFFLADASTIIVEGGVFNGVKSKSDRVCGITANGGKIIIKGGTFNFDPSAWVVPSSVVTKNGANWVVTPLPVSNNISDAVANVEDGGKVVLAEGNYTMPSTGGKDVTIVGNKNTVINVGAPNAGDGNVTLDGVTIKAGQYKGFQHSNVVTYNNVTIESELFCYGAKDIFNNCTFNLNNGYVWTYGSKETVFNNCTFNTNGKAILVYNEGAGASNVTVKNCTFNATAGAKAGAIKNQNCAAIEIDNFQSSGVGAAHNVTAENNTVNANFSGEWRIKNFVDGAAVTVNGVAYETIALDGKAMTIDADKNVTVL